MTDCATKLSVLSPLAREPRKCSAHSLASKYFLFELLLILNSAYVLRGTAYHIAADVRIRERLYLELKDAIPSPSHLPALADLERLPYLSAVIQEGLRLCNPVTHRIARQFPDKSLMCHSLVIPAGATISMTALLIHQNERIFPEPTKFLPDRWLKGDQNLERYLVPFNRGPRSCLGINLARAEMYLILAAVFRQFSFDVSQVDKKRDIDVSHDYILGAQARDSPGILVKVEEWQ